MDAGFRITEGPLYSLSSVIRTTSQVAKETCSDEWKNTFSTELEVQSSLKFFRPACSGSLFAKWKCSDITFYGYKNSTIF